MAAPIRTPHEARRVLCGLLQRGADVGNRIERVTPIALPPGSPPMNCSSSRPCLIYLMTIRCAVNSTYMPPCEHCERTLKLMWLPSSNLLILHLFNATTDATRLATSRYRPHPEGPDRFIAQRLKAGTGNKTHCKGNNRAATGANAATAASATSSGNSADAATSALNVQESAGVASSFSRRRRRHQYDDE